MPKKRKRSKPCFPEGMYAILSNPDTQDVVSWTKDGERFKIHKLTEFCNEVLPAAFNHTNYSSFLRQLNLYCIRKVGDYEFRHPHLRRDHPEDLDKVVRKPPASRRRGARGKKKGTDLSGEERAQMAAEIARLKARVTELEQEKEAAVDKLHRENAALWQQIQKTPLPDQALLAQTANYLVSYVAHLLQGHDPVTSALEAGIELAHDPQANASHLQLMLTAPATTSALPQTPARITEISEMPRGVAPAAVAPSPASVTLAATAAPLPPPTPVPSLLPPSYEGDLHDVAQSDLLQSLLADAQVEQCLLPYLDSFSGSHTTSPEMSPPAAPPTTATSSSTTTTTATTAAIPGPPTAVPTPSIDANANPFLYSLGGDHVAPLPAAAEPGVFSQPLKRQRNLAGTGVSTLMGNADPGMMSPEKQQEIIVALTNQLLSKFARTLEKRGLSLGNADMQAGVKSEDKPAIDSAMLEAIANDSIPPLDDVRKEKPLAVLISIIIWIGRFLNHTPVAPSPFASASRIAQ